jgi:hypothetical protein
MKAEKQENARMQHSALEMQKIPKSRGVGWHKKRGKWQVLLTLDGKHIHGAKKKIDRRCSKTSRTSLDPTA